LLSDGELVRLLCNHHRLLVYSECPRIDHTRAHVHTSHVHTGEALTRSRIHEILHLQITKLAPKG
jgi:hypothetical protein